jgi:hypothetical protein
MTQVEWGEAIGGWRLSASLDKATFAVEERVIVTTIFKNVSDIEQGYGIQGRDFDYIFDCHNDRGEKVSPTLFGNRMAENRGHGRYLSNQLPPGESLVNEISVTRHLDLSLPGIYTLTVSREVFPQEGRGPRLVSNAVQFEVTE